MAELMDDASLELPLDERLRLSIRWLSIEARSMFPEEAYAQFQIGLFLGDVPLFNQRLYPLDRRAYDFTLAEGYFYGEDDNCGLLRGIGELLDTGKALDFEDVSYPLFRLVIANDVFDLSYRSDGEPILFDVIAVIQSGAACHGRALASSGPAARLTVTPTALRNFRGDLLTEAMDPAVSDEASRQVLSARFADRLVARPD